MRLRSRWLAEVFAPLKKNLPDPWVWLHLPGLSSKIESFNPRGFSPLKISHYTVHIPAFDMGTYSNVHSGV